MNKIIKKKNISILILIIVSLLFASLIYFLNQNIKNYKEKVLNDYVTLARLELDKKVFDLYKRAALKDSEESKKIKKYVFSDDRKQLLDLINQLEDYTYKNNLSVDNSSIVSVSKRDNASLSKFNARDLIINISVAGDIIKIENFLNLLNTLPLISYIEKVDIKYDSLNNKNIANISLVIYQKDAAK